MNYRVLVYLLTTTVWLSVLTVAACGTGQTDTAPTEGDVQVFTSAAACNQCSNCVQYARCMQPALPFGLSTYKNKKDIVNRYTPSIGCVAIINTGDTTGHVAYVWKVAGSTVTIKEGNWPWGKCGERTNSPDTLGIVGYYCP